MAGVLAPSRVSPPAIPDSNPSLAASIYSRVGKSGPSPKL